MSEQQPLSMKDCMEHLTNNKQQVQGIKILQLALPIGVLTFIGVVCGLYFLNLGNPPKVQEGSGQMILILSLLHGLVTLTNTILALAVFPKVMLSPEKCRQFTKPAQLFEKFNATRILQLAMIEGAALFGVVICIIGVLGGNIYHQPLIWLNLASSMILFSFAFSTIPNEQSMRKFFEQTLHQR